MENMRKNYFFVALFALSIFFCASKAFAAPLNLLQNADFERNLGDTVGNGNWNSEANRGISRVTAGDAPQGASYMRLSEPNTVNAGFGGVFTFQTVSSPATRDGDRVAFSGLVRLSALTGGEAGQIRIEYQTSAGALLAASTTSISAVTNGFQRFVVSGTAPAGTGQITFVIRIQPSTAGDVGGVSVMDVDDMLGTINGFPLLVEARPATADVKPGDIKLVTLGVSNLSADSIKGEILIQPQDGLIIKADQSGIDGRAVQNREGSVIFNFNLNGTEETAFGIPVVLTSAAVPGKAYELIIFARMENGFVSEPIHVTIRPKLDPVFDEGTIIGKVFNDVNKNGVQDDCVFVGAEENCSGAEKGVPFAQLATEYGVFVTTDEHGRYHIPAVRPGRHVVKIDGHSLPEGTEFITEESYVVKITPGILGKANFAVYIPPSELPEAFEKDLSVSVTQSLDTARPDLGVRINPEIVKVGIGVLEKEPVFSFKINYPEMVKSWYLEIRDELGREIWTGFGVSTPPAEVVWPGRSENGQIVKPGVYSYQFKVDDGKGRQDWTPLNFFRVISKQDPDAENKLPEIAPIGDFNIFRDGKRSIPLVAKPTLRIQGRTLPKNKVAINGHPVEVDSAGLFKTEIYTTPGEKEIQISATNRDGETTTVQKHIKVKDSTFFMVALSEEQLGVNFENGSLESVASDTQYRDGFYEDGRIAYNLRGKLKGKFLFRSRYDTADKRNALFTNLDQDQYYPIYGDASTRDYEGQDTLSRFYFLVEFDRSYVKYGSFKTAFTDTELSTYNRTLSGVKGSYESTQSTVYGDPKRAFKAFGAKSKHLADHNEFSGTGGSLYYLRFRGVIEGSEKLRVEVRDKIQDLTLHSYDLVEGKDYEIDYREGRILLARPLSSIASTDTLGTVDILDGSPVYLIADYEYDAGTQAFEVDNQGARGYTHMGEHIKVGATAIQEKRQNATYDLRGVDSTIKVGRNTKVTMEYAESKLDQTSNAISFNGGLSFANLSALRPAKTTPEKAYLLKAESKPVKNLETSGYIQGIQPTFSNDHVRTEAGQKKYGMSAKYKFTDAFYARYRFDTSELERRLLPLAQTGVLVPYNDSLRNHTFQTVFDNGNWLAEAEYRRQQAQLDDRQFILPTLLSEIPAGEIISVKLGKRYNERILPYVKVVTGFREKPNHQFGGGVRYELMNNLYAYVEQMFGNLGDSTVFGIEKQQGAMRSYGNLKMIDSGVGLPLLATTVGNSFALSEKSRVYSERQHSAYSSLDGYDADVTGYDNQINDNWSFELKGERRHLKNSTTRLLDQQAQASLIRANTFNSVSTGVAYSDKKKTKFQMSVEHRRDQDTPRASQWVSRNFVEYKWTKDLSLLSKFNYGDSQFLNPDDTTAHFTEFSSGFAYRPVDNDRLNMLGRYTYLNDIGNDVQFYNGLYSGAEVDEAAHILAVDLAYELHRYLGLVEKLAYKKSLLSSNVTDEIILHTFLWVNRLNFHVTRKWDVALEYRTLWQYDAAQTLKQGVLAEIDRELYDYVRVGLGYNFTDFDDDLRKSNDVNSHGPFVRLTGKF